ncbi:MAG: GNAT family N-acetyltransferase [Candidatus Nomurabacteria bacterium]|nr:MAG: GNAT family N-acetyltransferase [Candidatus Nomurabacteria bacterium]
MTIGHVVEEFKSRYIKRQLDHNFIVLETQNNNQLNLSYRLRYEVYCLECKYLDVNNYPNRSEKDEYDDCSIHFIAINKKTKNVVGTIRLIKRTNRNLPIEHDFGISLNGSISSKKVVEISRLAVDKKFRKSSLKHPSIMLGLLKACYRYAEENGIAMFVAAIDQNVYNMLKKFRFSFNLLGEPKHYMGSISVPVLIDIEKESQWLKIVNPGLWTFLSSN